MSFHATFSGGESFRAEFSTDGNLKASFDKFIEVPVVDYYNGDYNITPTAQQQTIPIIGKTARQNITVGPIPSNYGLITWNGSTLTVS